MGSGAGAAYTFARGASVVARRALSRADRSGESSIENAPVAERRRPRCRRARRARLVYAESTTAETGVSGVSAMCVVDELRSCPASTVFSGYAGWRFYTHSSGINYGSDPREWRLRRVLPHSTQLIWIEYALPGQRAVERSTGGSRLSIIEDSGQTFSPSCGSGGTGRRASLRSLWPQGRGGSNPLFRTNLRSRLPTHA